MKGKINDPVKSIKERLLTNVLPLKGQIIVCDTYHKRRNKPSKYRKIKKRKTKRTKLNGFKNKIIRKVPW